MGLFGSSHKTYYNSVSSPLYEKVPSIIKQTIASSITQNRNIAEDLITNLANGVGFNANRLYAFGKSGNYQWGLPTGAVASIAPNSNSYIKLIIEAELGVPIHLSSTVIETDILTGNFVYEADYYLLNSKGESIGDVLIWTYDESTKVYPLLNIENKDTFNTSPYYPVIPIYRDQEYLAEEGSPLRQQITQACRYLSIKPDKIHEAISGDPDYPDNPVEDAYIVLAVSLDTEEQIGMEYLYRFLNHLNSTATVTGLDYTYWENAEHTETPPYNTIKIEDANYKVELDWVYTKSEIKTGNLLREDGTNATSAYYATAFEETGPIIIQTGRFTYKLNVDSFIVRKQINSTQYEEISIYGLVYTNWTVAKEARVTLRDVFMDEDDEGIPLYINIPLRKDLLSGMGGVKTHDLMYSSIRLVVNDKQRIKLKWYQTGLFQAILTIIAIVISIYYPPAGVAVGSAAAVGIAIAQVVIMKTLFPIAYKALADIFGEEIALLIAVVAVAFGFGSGATVGNALQAANMAIAGISRISLTKEMEAIQNEFDILKEELDIIEEEAAERQRNVLFASTALTGDPYAIMQATAYVRRFHLKSIEPTLLKNLTHSFTDVARFTDRPDSYIRLGHTGT